MAVRIENKKDKIELKVLDNNYKEKSNNTAELQVKFSNSIKISSCTFPNKYNDTILINCTIFDVNNINIPNEGLEYVNTSDKINILSKNLELNNFFQANNKIVGHDSIIIEGNKDKIYCFLSFSLKNGSVNTCILFLIVCFIVLILSAYL